MFQPYAMYILDRNTTDRLVERVEKYFLETFTINL